MAQFEVKPVIRSFGRHGSDRFAGQQLVIRLDRYTSQSRQYHIVASGYLQDQDLSALMVRAGIKNLAIGRDDDLRRRHVGFLRSRAATGAKQDQPCLSALCLTPTRLPCRCGQPHGLAWDPAAGARRSVSALRRRAEQRFRSYFTLRAFLSGRLEDGLRDGALRLLSGGGDGSFQPPRSVLEDVALVEWLRGAGVLPEEGE